MFKVQILVYWIYRRIISDHFSKPHCNIKNRPDDRELGKHFDKNNNINDNLNVHILQNNIKTETAQRYHED